MAPGGFDLGLAVAAIILAFLIVLFSALANTSFATAESKEWLKTMAGLAVFAFVVGDGSIVYVKWNGR